MTDAASLTLDDLLSRWHWWDKHRPIQRQAKASACGFEAYRTSRQYDDANGALDTDLECSTMRQVDHEVQQMADPYRSAVYELARNISTGYSVWRSPRLPADAMARAAVIVTARKMLTLRLERAGVLTP